MTMTQKAYYLQDAWQVSSTVLLNIACATITSPTTITSAERAANVSTYLTTHYNYTGIDPATGIPTGFVQLSPTTSPDGEYGLPKDPEQVTARNLNPAADTVYVNNSYGDPLFYETPRTVRLSVTYDH